VSGEILEASLRMTYDFTSFKETELYNNLREWEAKKNTKIF